MSQLIDDDIRDALQHKVTKAYPVNLADAALARAGKVQMRRRVATGAAALAVLAAAAIGLPPAFANRPVQIPATAGESRVDFGDGYYLAAGPTADGTKVWSPQTSSYIFYAGHSAWPDPTMTRVAVADDKEFYIESIGGGSRWDLLTGQALSSLPQWSPDGKKVLFGASAGADGAVSYRLANVEAKTIDTLNLGCGIYCQLAWLPDLGQVGHRTESGMDVYSVADGTFLHSLSYQAVRLSGYAPDRILMVGTKAGETAVLDASTGVPQCTSEYLAGPSSVIGWTGPESLVTLTGGDPRNALFHRLTKTCSLMKDFGLPTGFSFSEPGEYTIGFDR